MKYLIIPYTALTIALMALGFLILGWVALILIALYGLLSAFMGPLVGRFVGFNDELILTQDMALPGEWPGGFGGRRNVGCHTMVNSAEPTRRGIEALHSASSQPATKPYLRVVK